MAEPARAIAHVGITVPDMDAAIEWYSKVFGMRPIKDVGVLAMGLNGPIDDLCVDIFGAEFESQYGAELPIADFENSNWHMFHLVLPDRITRADFMQRMLDFNIGVGFHYAAIHLFTLYRNRGFKEGMFPVAERVCRQIVTLPLFPAMTRSDVERVVTAVKAILRR